MKLYPISVLHPSEIDENKSPCISEDVETSFRAFYMASLRKISEYHNPGICGRHIVANFETRYIRQTTTTLSISCQTLLISQLSGQCKTCLLIPLATETIELSGSQPGMMTP